MVRRLINEVAALQYARHAASGLISLNAYQLLEDAWNDGVAQWCRDASGFVLRGGTAWMLTLNDGQGSWMRSRLLSEGISLFGIQFMDVRSLRRELCVRLGMPFPPLGTQTLEFLLRFHALRSEESGFELSSVARHPGACLRALDDLANAGWLDDTDLPGGVLPSALRSWLPELRASGAWTAEVDRQLLERSANPLGHAPPLSICVCGWDASLWPSFNLLLAAVRAASDARIYAPSPRGTSQTLQQSWLEALEAATESDLTFCANSDFLSAQASLVGRLEGTDFESATIANAIAEPELLVGVDGEDVSILARDFTVRWLTSHRRAESGPASASASRLVILCPCRNSSSVGVVRALLDAGLAVEDELGEIPEPSFSVQIQRAVLRYHQENAGLEPLLALIELLNEYAAVWNPGVQAGLRHVFPLDAVEAHRAFRGAFADVQHHGARVLSEAVTFLRSGIASGLRDVITHLGEWPETLGWTDALRRWEDCLTGFGLTTEVLEPTWSRLVELPIVEPVPSAAFFQYLGSVLACGVPARRPPEAAHRFARIVVTTLEGAVGQTWGGVLLLDANEGAWPLYPPENPFLDDAVREALNERRAATLSEDGKSIRHHLLTSSDHAQLEHFRFLEVLENCTGPLAFAGLSRDPADPTRELYPNEWALRCLVEGGRVSGEGEKLLDRWRHAVRQAERRAAPLGKREGTHLGTIFSGRRDAERPFDQYLFNFDALHPQDELPFADHWSARSLGVVWDRPATFALAEIFGAEPWHDRARELVRGEGWMIGRLVHRWLHAALKGSREPRQLNQRDWRLARTTGIAQARAETEKRLRAATFAGNPAANPTDAAADLPLWWQGVLHKADWATRRCLENLAAASNDGNEGSPRWLCLDKEYRAELPPAAGRLRVRAHCDVLLLDRPVMAGANCQMIDIRTGAIPSAISASAAQLENGRGIAEAALLFLAAEEGADAEKSSFSVIHPDTALVKVLDASTAPLLTPTLERLAARQRSSCFGQRGGIVESSPGRRDAEDLPLATTAIDPGILEAKTQCRAK